MSDTLTLAAVETGDLIVQVDNSRVSNDPFKLPAFLRTVADARLAAAKSANAAAAMPAGDKVGASVAVQEALEKLRGALRNGYNHIKAIPDDDITAAKRAAAFEHYGWTQGKLGDLESPTRVNDLADLAVAGASSVLAIARYPASVMTKISNWLATLEAKEPLI